MADSKKKNITRTRVKHFKNNRLDKRNGLDLYVNIDQSSGFNYDDEVVVLKCSEFPEIRDIKSLSDLRKKLNELSDYTKRVKELSKKLESAQQSYQEEINVLKVKKKLEIKNLKKENTTLKRDNKELSLRLKDVTRRINELNSLLNDL